MALTPATHKISQSVSGTQFRTYSDGGSPATVVQGVVVTDPDGNPVGGELVPLHVAAVAFEHYELHQGDAYSYSDVITLGSAGTQDYLLTVADDAEIPHFSYTVEGIYGITVELYEGADRTGTTAQDSFNRNRNHPDASTLAIHKGTSGGTTDGTRIMWKKSGSGPTGGKLSGHSSAATELVLARDTKYLFRVTSAAASNDISVELNYYLHGLE